jgi:hypothetical protein
MKHLFVIYFISSFLTLAAQDITKINIELEIPDSLSKAKELRIYKYLYLSQSVDVLRLYQQHDNLFMVECYRYKKHPKTDSLDHKMLKLTKDSFDNLIWLKIDQSHILNLPNMDDIRYKLHGKVEISNENGFYEVSKDMITISDGVGYRVLIKDEKDKNDVYYDNPESYYTHYPFVDELDYFTRLLDLIRLEIGVWRE